MRVSICLLIMILIPQLSFANLKFEGAYVYDVGTGMKMSSAYFTMKNESSQKIILTKIDSKCSTKSEFHNMLKENGMMKMKKMEEVLILAGERVQFKPRGKHIMLLGLTEYFMKNKSCVFNITDTQGKTYQFTANKKKR